MNELKVHTDGPGELLPDGGSDEPGLDEHEYENVAAATLGSPVGVNPFANDVDDEALPQRDEETGDRLTSGERARLRELETKVEVCVASIGDALLTIRDERLYREAHARFEDYVLARFDLKRSTAYEHIDAARVRRAVGGIELTHSQCVAIALLPEDQWQSAARAVAGMTVAETKRIVRKRRAALKGERSPADDLLHQAVKQGRANKVPGVLKALAKAAAALEQLDENKLGVEDLSEEQEGEFEEKVALIRRCLDRLDTRISTRRNLAAS